MDSFSKNEIIIFSAFDEDWKEDNESTGGTEKVRFFHPIYYQNLSLTFV